MAQRQFRSDDTSLWVEKYGNGSDGALTVSSNVDDSAPNTTISVADGATAATAGSGTGFANGDLIAIHQSRNGGDTPGDWELNKISSIGGGTNWTLAYPATHAYNTTAQVVKLFQYSSITVQATKTLATRAWDTVAKKGGIMFLLCNGTVNLANLTGLNGGFLPANGITSAGSGRQGEGTGGDRDTQSTAANGNGGGGGEQAAGLGYGGGGGGNATAGQNGGNNGGVGGLEAGNAELTKAVLGGGGASGGIGSATHESGFGGRGAGFICVIAKFITVTEGVHSDALAGSNSNDGNAGGGGGGAGGSILFKGLSIILGTNLVTALGAVGGGGGPAGGTGADGRIHIDYAHGVSGATQPAADTRRDGHLETDAFAQMI